MGKCTEAEQTTAVNRQKIINAYDASGLSAEQFADLYNKGFIAPEIRERLGRWGLLKSTSVFYSHWLLRYQQFGLAGLVPQYNRDRGGAGAALPQEARDRIEWLYLDANKPSAEVV